MLIEFLPNGTIDETSSTRRISFFFVVEVTRELYTLEGCALTVHLTNSYIYYLIIQWTTRSFYFIFYFLFFFFLSAIECEASTKAALGLADWNATVHSDTLFQGTKCAKWYTRIIITKAVHSTLLAARARKYYYRKGLDPRRSLFLSETHTLLDSSTLFCEIVSVVST